MSATEPQNGPDVVSSATPPPSPYRVAAYSEPPKFGWEISPNRIKRALTYLGLHNFRDFMIAVISATLAVIVTLGVQAVFGEDKDNPSVSGQVSYGGLEPELFEPSLKAPKAPVTVYVGPEAYKALPADVKNNLFCRSTTSAEPCNFEYHVLILEKMLDKRQLSYLYRVINVLPEEHDWSFVEVTDWQHINALPGDISAAYWSDGSLKRAEIYVK